MAPLMRFEQWLWSSFEYPSPMGSADAGNSKLYFYTLYDRTRNANDPNRELRIILEIFKGSVCNSNADTYPGPMRIYFGDIPGESWHTAMHKIRANVNAMNATR